MALGFLKMSHSAKTGPRKGELERMVNIGGKTDTWIRSGAESWWCVCLGVLVRAGSPQLSW